MKRILFCLLLLTTLGAQSQVYNNEWITDYNKTYYKFKVGKTGLYRISQSVLSTAGLGAVPAEHFQLWRNGVQVPIYTSQSTGALGSADYIEFWGEMNDGRPDSNLYRRKEYQLNNKWSLQTDTAAYFLTTNTAGANLRLETTVNNVAGNVLPVEPFFLHTTGKYFKDKINNGRAVEVAGEYMYSSSYDRGEGWSSSDIGTNLTNTNTFNNLFVYTGLGAPLPNFNISVSGNSAYNPRRFKVTINGDSVAGKSVDYFNDAKDAANFPIATIANNTAVINVTNITSTTNDRMVIHKYEMTYPRIFNFGGATNFEFTMPASSGNYLEITGFSYGSAAPVLYDVANGKRYVGDITTPGTVKFVLVPASKERKMVLVNEEAGNITEVGQLQSRSFINYSLPANAGNYLIISNPLLFNGTNGVNPVEEYRLYRSSAVGGAFNAKVYLIEDIVDQFGFGIKKHPLAIRNFLQYARAQFPSAPAHAFLIGKGTNYLHYRNNQSHADIERLNLLPTFGWPASDALLAAEYGDGNLKTPIGRLSVIRPQEVEAYLKKVKDFELAQRTPSHLIKDKAWMKNVIHIVGAGGDLGTDLTNYMLKYEKIVEDTLFGGKTTLFTKTSAANIEQISNGALDRLFEEGISLMTYYGHSSATTLEFNLNNPDQYHNYGKYPLFIALGCNAGNYFNFNPLRFQTTETLAEKFVLAPDKGMIGFMASSHFGIVNYLDIYNTIQYNALANKLYGKSIGEIMQYAIAQTYAAQTQEDFYARAQCEETTYHGDPAIKLNPHPKPDYVIEEPLLKVAPSFVSVADQSFKLQAKFLNIGKATSGNVVVEVKRELPNGDVSIIHRDTLPGIRYADSISIDVPIEPTRDKGVNKLTVTVDVDNNVDEIFENNNTVTKEIVIYEDEARPIYPYDFAIVSQQGIKLMASTANPFSPSKNYRMEIDTTEFFTTPLATSTISSVGGVMEFNPGITFTDGTVYYWRVAPVPASGGFTWNTASFVYLPNHDAGFNQSHIYQHFKSERQQMELDSTSRLWQYGHIFNNLSLQLGTFVTSGATQESSLAVSVNGVKSIRLTCWFSSLVFNVFDPITFQPWTNTTLNNTSNGGLGLGLYESLSNNCYDGRQKNFEYRYTDTAGRRKMMTFMRDVIPDGSYVVIRNFTLDPAGFPGFPVAYASDWAADQAYYGPNQSLYHYLKNAGLAGIDSFYRARPFALVYKKNDPTFTPRWVMGDGVYDNPTLSVDATSSDTVGYITSPKFGPAKAWKTLEWSGVSMDPAAGDNPLVDVIGITNSGSSAVLFDDLNLSQQSVNISTINPDLYPYVQLRMRNYDSVYKTPYQLKYWRLSYDPAPEGAVAPNMYFSMKDTVDAGEPIDFKMAFKNITSIGFDSLKVKMVVTDRNNIAHVLPVQKHRPLNGNDTLHIRNFVNTRQIAGPSTLYVEVNPDNDQPEQYHFNNFIFRDFYVRPDTLHPLLDVTFDNVHILNGDIVSAKPDILIKLKDESKWMLLDDTSIMKVQVRNVETGIVRSYSFNSDTLRLTPAQAAPNANNTAVINFTPYFEEDGEYELIVTGKDQSENPAGVMEYRVSFQVINKAMISNMLNYPNPFTTSTAFVFTITGSEVPQNLRIQVLTVTGKVVREITKDELGPLRVGRNITEFKWDGTDQYGQKLANGVYLYRVITNLNGKSLDKYRAKNDDTDKYFNKGYGKMYLMR